jgi:DNA (cytosine-5)-methyltransferase 1
MRLDTIATDGGQLLDAFCGVGGATSGYRSAGWASVTGVDIAPQDDYPGDLFKLDDAVAYIRDCGRDFAFIHASYPCQTNCTLTQGTNKGKVYPDLYHATKDALESTGRPYVMENVGGEIRRDVTLCGEMFGLGVLRHRHFELGGGLKITPPKHLPHRGRVQGHRHGKWYDGPYLPVYGNGGGKGSTTEWKRAMGITHTDDRHGISQAIPPAYTWWLTMNAWVDEH